MPGAASLNRVAGAEPPALHGDDLAHLWTVMPAPAMDDDVDRLAHERVECAHRQIAGLVGELSDDLDEGEIDIDHHGGFTEIEFEVNGHEAQVLVPRTWLGPATADEDAELDVAVRTVDVERVTPLGPCR